MGRAREPLRRTDGGPPGSRPPSLVVELASNDGYLLQHFLPRKIPVLGIEPAANVAEAARRRSPTIIEFFGVELAETPDRRGPPRRSHLGNNVLAQVPEINDFVAGVQLLLAPKARRPSSSRISHACSRASSTTRSTTSTSRTSRSRSISGSSPRTDSRVVDVEELSTHGGSSAGLQASQTRQESPRRRRVELADAREGGGSLRPPSAYLPFAEDVQESKRALLELLIGLRREGKQVVGYGAPGKGNTLLNYCGIRYRFPRLHRRPQPLQAGTFTPGTRHPDPPSGADRRDPPGCDP